MQNAPREHSAILSTFIKLPFIFKTFVLSIFELPFKMGFTAFYLPIGGGAFSPQHNPDMHKVFPGHKLVLSHFISGNRI